MYEIENFLLYKITRKKMAALSNTTQLFQYIHNFTYIIFFLDCIIHIQGVYERRGSFNRKIIRQKYFCKWHDDFPL